MSLQLPIALYVLVLERATGVRGHMFAHGLKQVPCTCERDRRERVRGVV
jgi:hypothetical protein